MLSLSLSLSLSLQCTPCREGTGWLTKMLYRFGKIFFSISYSLWLTQSLPNSPSLAFPVSPFLPPSVPPSSLSHLFSLTSLPFLLPSLPPSLPHLLHLPLPIHIFMSMTSMYMYICVYVHVHVYYVHCTS